MAYTDECVRSITARRTHPRVALIFARDFSDVYRVPLGAAIGAVQSP
jgi:hypothetical protein